MSDNLSIKDENEDHSNFTLLQNILSYIGLTAFERSLYWALREASRQKRSCTKSYAKLAKSSGMSEKSVQRTLLSLSLKNSYINKPLIKIKNRLTKDGDRDTNEIVLTDLWNDNHLFFQNNSGEVTQTPPQVTQTPGVRSHRPEGEVTQTYKQDIFNKIPFNKTTTTNKKKSSSSFPCEISQDVKDAAKKAFEFIQARSKTNPDEKWNLDLVTLEKQFHIDGIFYSTDQLNYVIDRMNKYKKNKNKQGNKISPIDDPRVYFNQSCSKNWAKSLHKKENE